MERSFKIALAGNPNVGKSTVFNALTGLKQHTGNWAGKTVGCAEGSFTLGEETYLLADIPGTYSLRANSEEEEHARDYVLFGEPDAVIVVCDATSLDRNLTLALQMTEVTPHVVVCVNLLDEAKKKHIHVDLEKLERRLGLPVAGTSARAGKGLNALIQKAADCCKHAPHVQPIRYSDEIEKACHILMPSLERLMPDVRAKRYLALRLIEEDPSLICALRVRFPHLLDDEEFAFAWKEAKASLLEAGSDIKDEIVETLYAITKDVCSKCVVRKDRSAQKRRLKIDKILTGRWTGIPIMLLLLALIFWITITGANYPSALLSDGLFKLQDLFAEFLFSIHAPQWLVGVLVFGIYRVLAWVVSVMLPPMAIFFPLFTLLEDLGYLPRVAFNMDKSFQRCCACGKQALTMWLVYLWP